jgi:hypothetical protein
MTSSGKMIQQQQPQILQQNMMLQQQPQQPQIIKGNFQQPQFQHQQVLSPQQQQQQQHQQQMKNMQSSSPSTAQSSLAMASSPLKHELTTHHYNHPPHQQPPPVHHMPTPAPMTGPPLLTATNIQQSPKTVTKIIKTESSDLIDTINAVSKTVSGDLADYEKTGLGQLGVELPSQQDKKTGGVSSGPVSGGSNSTGVTIGASGKPMTNLDLIRANKEERFLNVNLLHKKFVEMARKYKLDDVATEVGSLISHACQEYMKNLLEKLDIVAQHRLDLSTRVSFLYLLLYSCIV